MLPGMFNPMILASLTMHRVILTSGTSWTKDPTWNDTNNTIEAIGAGGNGTSEGSGAGGGGAYSKVFNVPLVTNTSYRVGLNNGSTGSGITPTSNSYFKDSSTLIAAGGATGIGSSGGAGGLVANCVGTTRYAGGNGSGGGGGGGAAGAGGAGNNGIGSVGGSGDAGFGGAGGNGSNGGAGTEWDLTHGSGGGGAYAFNAGLYGGGGGGAAGAGGAGLIILTWYS